MLIISQNHSRSMLPLRTGILQIYRLLAFSSNLERCTSAFALKVIDLIDLIDVGDEYAAKLLFIARDCMTHLASVCKANRRFIEVDDIFGPDATSIIVSFLRASDDVILEEITYILFTLVDPIIRFTCDFDASVLEYDFSTFITENLVDFDEVTADLLEHFVVSDSEMELEDDIFTI